MPIDSLPARCTHVTNNTTKRIISCCNAINPTDKNFRLHRQQLPLQLLEDENYLSVNVFPTVIKLDSLDLLVQTITDTSKVINRKDKVVSTELTISSTSISEEKNSEVPNTNLTLTEQDQTFKSTQASNPLGLSTRTLNCNKRIAFPNYSICSYTVDYWKVPDNSSSSRKKRKVTKGDTLQEKLPLTALPHQSNIRSISDKDIREFTYMSTDSTVPKDVENSNASVVDRIRDAISNPLFDSKILAIELQISQQLVDQLLCYAR